VAGRPGPTALLGIHSRPEVVPAIHSDLNLIAWDLRRPFFDDVEQHEQVLGASPSGPSHETPWLAERQGPWRHNLIQLRPNPKAAQDGEYNKGPRREPGAGAERHRQVDREDNSGPDEDAG
jgi:hypothetical protein